MKTDSHFLPGFLIGAAVGIIFCGVLYITGPEATYDRVLDETGADLIQRAQQLEGCTAAYVASHAGKLPKGTLVEGEGRGLIVVGFDSADAPQGLKK